MLKKGKYCLEVQNHNCTYSIYLVSKVLLYINFSLLNHKTAISSVLDFKIYNEHEFQIL